MARNLLDAHPETYISKDIIPGVIIGGFVGILFGYLLRTNILIIPAISAIFSMIQVNEIIGGALIGIIIGGLIGGFSTLISAEDIYSEYVPETCTPKQSTYDSEYVTLQIKEEEIDLAKKWIQTGKVNIYREHFTEEKSFAVSVEREELVIEKQILASATSEHKDMPTEVIRIRLSEEQVELTKHKVVLEDVSIYKQQIEDIKHIEETLKREQIKIETFNGIKQ